MPSDSERTAEQDAREYGIGITKDGQRIDPNGFYMEPPSDSEREAVKPCPFCGEDAEIHAAEYGDGMRAVCIGCGLELEAENTGRVIALWNGPRTPPVASEPREEDIAQAILAVDTNWKGVAWHELPLSAREVLLKYARAAITAYREGK